MLEGLFRNAFASNPWLWAIMAAIPPAILALYFLKLRRAPVEVPSTYLWMRAIEDLHVNSLWQKLRQSLLLLLQLLLVGLVILALLRPGWQGTRLDGQRFIFLVDNSASMSAKDIGGDSINNDGGSQTRLEASKEKISALIDQLQRGMTAMIISYSDSPRVVQQFTDNRRLLQERLATIEPTAASTDIAGALRLAGGLANPGQLMEDGDTADVVEPLDTTLYLFTDGRFKKVEDFALGNLKPIYVPVGDPESANLAITAFNTRRNEARPQEKEAFVQVSNFSGEPRKVVVDLLLDGQFLDARSADAPADGTASYTFPLADAPAGKLEARIDGEALTAAGDVLPLDDNAFATIDDADPGKILLVTPGNIVVETALSTARAGRLGGIEQKQPSALEDKQLIQQLRTGDYDLVIFDRCRPKSAAQMPRASTFFIGQIPPLKDWQGGKTQAAGADDPPPQPETVSVPQVIDWNRAHPLMAYVDVGDLLIGESQVLAPPAGASTLIESTAGPLLAVAPRDSFEDLVLGFPILTEEDGQTVVNTKWYASRSFPTFWLNVLDYFVGSTGDPTRGQSAPGKMVELRLKGAVSEVTVTGPGDLKETLKRNDEGPFIFQQTSKRGVYDVSAGGAVRQRFAVNLFDGAESDVRLRLAAGEGPMPKDSPEADIASLKIGFSEVVARPSHSPARKEMWRWLLGLAIGVLLFEWYIYNRRVYL